ncbi:GNAT family N-acetyltransferase [Celeribacter neptunius]|uniref:Acetyltransferase (GNAT) domain-containing protein n=1 Tax=Celeribacter neptunius TaxID=588602 RepID=A0A1I3LW79_9RHOB|nr:GNAT family N-acetyltransferase [Celeribacter neptunius]SFI88972.1 Acetyltransferase (GNAT) domain-containing protein [Celeribacter neptunius]
MREQELQFTRLTEIAPEAITAHMSEPFVARHMPLLKGRWTERTTRDWVAAKEAHWQARGLGHWGFLAEGSYVGWGGFEREGEDWDFGLVLTPAARGLGQKITAKALDFARNDPRIDSVTFLLPPTRRHFGALTRLGARRDGEATHGEETFLRFRLDLTGPSAAPGAQ